MKLTIAVFRTVTTKIGILVLMSDADPPHSRFGETLGVVERFLNTRDLRTFTGARRGPYGEEEISDAPALTRWLLREHLVRRGVVATDDDVRLAHALRDDLRAALIAHKATGKTTPARGALHQLLLRVDFDKSGSPGLVPAKPDRDVRAALAGLLARVVVAAARGEWERLRTCDAEDCGWVFYDRSKPGTGRWCAMRVCGNRVKTRAYRESSRVERQT
jgi:predicted RNA-binding Zn ribbon-like protein